MKKENLKISVIVPVYKVEQYLQQCIDSIINQTYKNLEIILIDDGSPDNCPQICDEYAKKDERIIVIHQKNSGQSVARNVGLEKASGEIIAFVDSDDFLEIDAYERLLDFLISEKLNVVFMSAFILEEGKNKEKAFEYYPDKYICNTEEILVKSLRDDIGGQPWLKIYKRECFENVRFPEGRIYEDLAMSFLPFVLPGKVGFLSDKPLYNYRLNKQGTTLTKNPKKAYQLFTAFLDHLVYAQENYKEHVDYILWKTAFFAITVINQSIISIEKWNQKQIEINNTREFLIKNKKEILKNKKLSFFKKVQIWGYLAFPNMYILALKGIKKIK